MLQIVAVHYLGSPNARLWLSSLPSRAFLLSHTHHPFYRTGWDFLVRSRSSAPPFGD